MGLKECRKCHRLLELGAFYAYKSADDAKYMPCRQCEVGRTRKRKPEQSAYAKKHYREKREEIIAGDKRYSLTESARVKRSLHRKNRRDSDENYWWLNKLRVSLYAALKGRSRDKTVRELVGCSSEQLHQYITEKFKSGMSWENYGKAWEIDHVKPCVTFDLTNPKQRQQCFHYSNLQPLLPEQNRKKWMSPLKP